MDHAVALEPLKPGVTWEALRLPGSSRQALRGLAAGPLPGVLALFHGPGRTGKTMVAQAFATHLGLTGFRVDLRPVVSTHSGETERHLDAVFDAVPGRGALLLLDEADALIGPRRGVRDAHDRYANTEIASLLQRLDAFDGVAILGTTAQREVSPDILRRCAAVVGIPRTP